MPHTLFDSLKSDGVFACNKTDLSDKPARFTKFLTKILVSSASSTIIQNKFGTRRNKCDNLEREKRVMSIEHLQVHKMKFIGKQFSSTYHLIKSYREMQTSLIPLFELDDNMLA